MKFYEPKDVKVVVDGQEVINVRSGDSVVLVDLDLAPLPMIHGHEPTKDISEHIERMLRIEENAVDAAVRRVLELDFRERADVDGFLTSSSFDAAEKRVAERGLHLVHHRHSDDRPNIELRERGGRVLWDGWWERDGNALTWREEWHAPFPADEAARDDLVT